MGKTLGYVVIIVFIAVSICLAATKPEWVSDSNAFLENFVDHEFLNLLGVILAITLASVANVHFELNKIEEQVRREGAFPTSRANLRKNAWWLIGLFLAGVVLVTVKPLVATTGAAQALTNMGALLILLWQVLILVGLTKLAFAISPIIDPVDDTQQPPKVRAGPKRPTKPPAD